MTTGRRMDMSVRTLLIGSTLLITSGLLVGGIYYPNDFFMHFAASSPVYTALRVSIIVIMVGLLLTEPPRSVVFRTIVASWAVLLTSLVINLLVTYQVNLFDIIMFMELAVIFTIESLEAGTPRMVDVQTVTPKRSKPARKVRVIRVV
jgi:hypothetical protein